MIENPVQTSKRSLKVKRKAILRHPRCRDVNTESNPERSPQEILYDDFGFVVGHVCPVCGGKLERKHVDDVGTQFYECEKCGRQTACPKSSTRKDLEELLKNNGNYTEESLPSSGKLSTSDKKASHADKLVELCLSKQPTLFLDQTATPYARINENDVNVLLPLRSQHFKAWLANLLWDSKRKVPGTQAVYSALNVLIAIANSSNLKYTLYNRVAPAEDGFWIDLCDDKWCAIKVTKEGWQIVKNPPILFKRYSHQRPLSVPEPGGDPWKFLNFINIDPADSDTRLILLCTVMSFLIPSIPHPIICTYGHQGSGKTLMFILIRRLLDPSAIEVMTLSSDERERVQQLDHHWCAFYDNITSLPTQISDTLCRAATGSGFSKRQLYTDDDDIIFNFIRCIGLNGINIAASRGDLLDRCLLVFLLPIRKDKRKTEADLHSEFEGCKAGILGGFLDTLVKALQLCPSIKPKNLFRMADFTKWGCAIAVALGQTEEDFMNAYEKKVNNQTEEAAHASPVATVLLNFMDSFEDRSWKGTPTDLFAALINHAKILGISAHQKSWPKAPHALVRQLNELAPSLKALGWEVAPSKSGGTRTIQINSVPSDPKEDREGQGGGAGGASDASTAVCSCKLNDLREVHWGDELFGEHECGICGHKKSTSWQGITFDGRTVAVCDDCAMSHQEMREA